MAKIRSWSGISVQWLVSVSLTLAPFYGLPATAQNSSSPTAPSELAQSARLLLDMEDMLDRALYPDVPRQVPSGAPTLSEINQIQIRVAKLHESYAANFQTRLNATTSETEEINQVVELNSFFTAAQRLETLKIVMGLPVQNEKWEQLYGINISLDQISQIKFLAVTSMPWAAMPKRHGWPASGCAKCA